VLQAIFHQIERTFAVLKISSLVCIALTLISSSVKYMSMSLTRWVIWWGTGWCGGGVGKGVRSHCRKRIPFGVKVERNIERLGMAFAVDSHVGTGMLEVGVVTIESYRSRQKTERFLRAMYMLSMRLRLD
jgi:hypothetical protein